MSRIGKQLIVIPSGVDVKIEGTNIHVKGPKGELDFHFVENVAVEVGAEGISVSVKNSENLDEKALWGTVRAIVANMITGVSEGFSKSLEVIGVGYKVNMDGKNLVLDVGFSHPVKFSIPEGLTASVEKNVITISGIDKQRVGELAAHIRKVRTPEPYKGKGIKYTTETVRRKAGKAVKTAAA